MPLPSWEPWGLVPSGIRLAQVDSLAGGPLLKQNTTPAHKASTNNRDKAMLAHQAIFSTQQLDAAVGKACRVYLWRRSSVPELRVA